MRLATRQAILYTLLIAGTACTVAAFFFLYRFGKQPSQAGASCAPILGVIGFLGLGFLLAMLTFALMPWASRTAWEGEAAGRRIRVINRIFDELLFIDDQLVAQHHGFSFGTTLRAAIPQEGGPPLPVEATVGGMLAIKCHCTVGGEPIAMREVGA